MPDCLIAWVIWMRQDVSPQDFLNPLERGATKWRGMYLEGYAIRQGVCLKLRIENWELKIENWKFNIPRHFGKHSLDVFSPLKRGRATRDHTVYNWFLYASNRTVPARSPSPLERGPPQGGGYVLRGVAVRPGYVYRGARRKAGGMS